MSVAGVASSLLALLQGLILACLAYQVILAVASGWPATPQRARSAVAENTGRRSPRGAKTQRGS
ncbi:MAG: hypothetical protein FJ026_14865, partial [Chloroflexi bacterium]|nr:hypothetical protein [Chloroflexota bacterium]